MTGIVRQAETVQSWCELCSYLWDEPKRDVFRLSVIVGPGRRKHTVDLCPDCIRFAAAVLDESRFRRLVTRVKEWLRG